MRACDGGCGGGNSPRRTSIRAIAHQRLLDAHHVDRREVALGVRDARQRSQSSHEEAPHSRRSHGVLRDGESGGLTAVG